MPKPSYAGCTFTLKQLKTLAVIGQGGFKSNASMEDFIEETFDGDGDGYFNTVMHLVTMGLVESMATTVNGDPEKELFIVFRLTEQGIWCVEQAAERVIREAKRHGEDLSGEGK